MTPMHQNKGLPASRGTLQDLVPCPDPFREPGLDVVKAFHLCLKMFLSQTFTRGLIDANFRPDYGDNFLRLRCREPLEGKRKAFGDPLPELAA